MFVIDAPANLAGDYDDTLSHKFNWTEDFTLKYYEERRFGGHDAFCKSVRGGQTITVPNQKYPDNVIEYVPEDKCSRQENMKH
jgi:hypothetical protein